MTSAAELFDDLSDVDIDQMVLDAYIGEVRELSVHDVKVHMLCGPASSGAAAVSMVTNMRAVHHVIARMAALGIPDADISERCGRSLAHISNLRNHSAAFKDLVEHYKGKLDEAMISHHEKIHYGAGLAVELVIDELETRGEMIPFDKKVKAMDSLLDRSGYGAKSTSHVVHHKGIDMAALRSMKAEVLSKELKHYDTSARELPAGQSAGTAGTELPALPERASSDRMPANGAALEGPAASHAEDVLSVDAAGGGDSLPTQGSGEDREGLSGNGTVQGSVDSVS